MSNLIKMREIIFKGAKIQRGFRIKIPKPIIDTLNINENQEIVIKFNPETKEIIIKEENHTKKK